MKYVPYITFVDSDGSVKKMAYDFGNNHRITKDLNNDISLKARSELMLSHGQNKTIKVAGMSYEDGEKLLDNLKINNDLKRFGFMLIEFIE